MGTQAQRTNDDTNNRPNDNNNKIKCYTYLNYHCYDHRYLFKILSFITDILLFHLSSTGVVIALTVLCTTILAFVVFIITLLMCLKARSYRNLDEEADDEHEAKHQNTSSKSPIIRREAWSGTSDERRDPHFVSEREKTLIKVVLRDQIEADTHSQRSYLDDELPNVVS